MTGRSWESTPCNTVLGKVNAPHIDGVKQALTVVNDTAIGSKQVEQVKAATHDRLGRGREKRGALRQLGEHYVHGKTLLPDEWGVKKMYFRGVFQQRAGPRQRLGTLHPLTCDSRGKKNPLITPKSPPFISRPPPSPLPANPS